MIEVMTHDRREIRICCGNLGKKLGIKDKIRI